MSVPLPNSAPMEFAATDVARSVLQVRNIAHQFGSKIVLRNVSLDVFSGETLVILGDSGCGKTTLLSISAGRLEPTSGDVLIDQKSLASQSVRERRIIYLDQESLLFEHLNVFENVAFSLRLAHRPRDEVSRRVGEVLRSVELEDHAQHSSWQLSGGQRQRTAFARAILANPKVLLLDEPFCSLDGRSRASMQELYIKLRADFQMTSVFVTHDVKEALRVGSRFAMMRDGMLKTYPSRQAFMEDESTGVSDEIRFWRETSE